MPGPCPTGASTPEVHKKAKCQSRERCSGPGCRYVRPERVKPKPSYAGIAAKVKGASA